MQGLSLLLGLVSQASRCSALFQVLPLSVFWAFHLPAKGKGLGLPGCLLLPAQEHAGRASVVRVSQSLAQSSTETSAGPGTDHQPL